MYRILEARNLAGNIYEMVVEAPFVARRCLPGQFIIAKLDEEAERIPLTICDYDREKGTITIVFQPVGVSTHKYVSLHEGDSFEDFVGPLGVPSDLCTEPLEEVKKKKILFVAGGVGTAPVYPQAKWLHEHGIECDVIIGAKSKDFVILENRLTGGDVFDVTILIKEKLTEELRHQIMFLLDQFRPIRTRIRLLQMQKDAVMDSNSYLDMNATIPGEKHVVLDEEAIYDGAITLL